MSMPLELPPGPPPVRRFTPTHARLLGRLARQPLQLMSERFERYGALHAGRIGDRVSVHVSDPDHIHQILVTETEDFHRTRTGLERLLGTGLLTSTPDVWKVRRKAMQPGFRSARISAYAQTMVAETERRSARWTADDELDVVAEMQALTLGILTQTLFSHRIAEPTDRVAEWLTVFQEAVGAFDPFPAWVPTPQHRRIWRAQANMAELLDALIAQREQATDDTEDGDLLDTLIGLLGHGGGAQRSDVRDELLTLFLAGHETTANALSWALWTLAADARVEARVMDELNTVLGARPVTPADLPNLPYLDAFCTEVLRFYPPVYVMLREAARDTRVGDWLVPKGATLCLWIYQTHRDPRWYPHPGVFEPERFLREPLSERRTHTFMPFGAGQHLCIGKQFALMELRLVLATLLRRWRFVGSGALPEPQARFTLRPSSTATLRVERRERDRRTVLFG